MLYEIPAEILEWMRKQSQSAFIGDMLQVYGRKGGLNEEQLLQVKVKYIQAGNVPPPRKVV